MVELTPKQYQMLERQGISLKLEEIKKMTASQPNNAIRTRITTTAVKPNPTSPINGPVTPEYGWVGGRPPISGGLLQDSINWNPNPKSPIDGPVTPEYGWVDGRPPISGGLLKDNINWNPNPKSPINGPVTPEWAGGPVGRPHPIPTDQKLISIKDLIRPIGGPVISDPVRKPTDWAGGPHPLPTDQKPIQKPIGGPIIGNPIKKPIETMPLLPGQEKMDTSLVTGDVFTHPMSPKTPSGMVYVYVKTNPGYDMSGLNKYGNVTGSDKEWNLTVMYVNKDNLSAISKLDGVRNISQVIPPVTRRKQHANKKSPEYKTTAKKSASVRKPVKKTSMKRTQPTQNIKPIFGVSLKDRPKKFGMGLLSKPKSIGKKALSKPVKLNPIKRKQSTNKPVVKRKPTVVKRKPVVRKTSVGHRKPAVVKRVVRKTVTKKPTISHKRKIAPKKR